MIMLKIKKSKNNNFEALLIENVKNHLSPIA
jgi:hypothetical protein